MIVDFRLKNADGLIIGKARLDLPTEDVQAVKLGLLATGQAYTECRYLEYDIYWHAGGDMECHGLMNIIPCPKDC